VNIPGRAWAALALLAALASVLAIGLPAAQLDWQPALAFAEPWRALTAAFVHWSGLHLGANLAGAAVVAAFGWAARVPLALTLAWAAAWPLTHFGLLLKPELAHYGGLSGVMHAGTAVGVIWLVAGPRAELPRGAWWIGGGVGVALVLKLLLEAPWGPALRTSDEWDIAIAPLAHSSGAVAGALCAAVVLVTRRYRGAPPQSPG
jgi:rhomboid family GlyGly-CTERM serine protease